MQNSFFVTHFTCTLDPKMGGISTGIPNVCTNLKPFGVNGRVISTGNTSRNIDAAKTQIHLLRNLGISVDTHMSPIDNAYGLSFNFLLHKKITIGDKEDLVVLHQVYTFSTLLGYMYAKRYGIPYAVMPHGSLTNYHESDSKLIKTLAKWFLISKILREADAIIVTCESERADLNAPLQAKAYQLKYGAIVSEPVDVSARMLHLSSQNPRIVFSGRFDKKKNLPLVIKAMPHILAQNPDLILDIAGSGTSKELRKLQSLISSLKLEGNIQFHGWIDNSKMQELLAVARLLVLPSENENFAIVVAEALSAGVPCVVSKFVGTADIIAKHHAGEVIDELTPTSVADGIMKVLQGDEIKYREAAIEAVQNSLDWSKIALQWKALVTSLA